MAENSAECTEKLVTETKVKSPSPTVNNETQNNVGESNESVNNKDLNSSENCKDNLDENDLSRSADNVENNSNAEDASEKEEPQNGENEASSPRPRTETTATKPSTESKEVNCSENNENKVCTEADQDESSEGTDTAMSEEEKRLKEILKVVHQDLDVKSFQKSIKSAPPKDVVKDDKEKKEENAAKINEPRKEETDDVDDSESKSSEPAPVQDDPAVQDVSEKMEEEKSEVGIVGPPTAISELVNEEELRVESALSVEEKVQDHVAEWVENSANVEVLINADMEEEDNETQNEVRDRRKNLREKRSRKKKGMDVLHLPARKSQKVVSSIIKKSIKCLNKMHAMEGAGGNGKKVDSAEKSREEDTSRASPKVPQNQQNGAALPEETAAATTTAERLRTSSIKKEPPSDPEPEVSVKTLSSAQSTPQKSGSSRGPKADGESGRKRKSTDGSLSANGNSTPKKICLEQREQFISSLVGCDKVSADELAARADQLRAEVQALDELARAKEMEWNEILSMRKLKEEAYLRVERRRQVMGFMEGNGQLVDTLPPATLALATEWENSSGASNPTSVSKEKCMYVTKEELPEEGYQESQTFKKEKHGKSSQRQAGSPKQSSENGRKQSDAQSPENRQIGEGRQGAIVDVRSIIADYRLRHPETVPRRGRRMRNSVNVGLGAGGAMVETHNVDSRPSSTDSCKSNPNAVDANNSMSFKDVLVQFAKLSQQQGEPVKTPQNYPDVTLHPVAPSPAPQNTTGHQTGSLLHGILTKSQSPRPTTFSPTLARLLTAPERERSAPTAMPQQNAATQHLLQAYQGSNPVSISDLLSSSKARTEITITPVVNTSVQSHSNNLIHVEDVEEDTSVIEERETRISSGGRESREDRDSPPRCQGCHERAAQFVCAGCGNQWYCSRECQVAAWDEHSEVCSG